MRVEIFQNIDDEPLTPLEMGFITIAGRFQQYSGALVRAVTQVQAGINGKFQ